jgi:hypothetical protein
MFLEDVVAYPTGTSMTGGSGRREEKDEPGRAVGLIERRLQLVYIPEVRQSGGSSSLAESVDHLAGEPSPDRGGRDQDDQAEQEKSSGL